MLYNFFLLSLFCRRDPSDPDAVLIKRVLGVAGDYVKYVDYFQPFELSTRADAPQPSYGAKKILGRGESIFFHPPPLSLIPFTV